MSEAVQADHNVLTGLRFVPRRAVRGQRGGMAGRHRSPSGHDFVQYRGYQQGDDPRLIDWKLWARSDRLFVRETEAESQLRVWFWLDNAPAMRVRDESTECSRRQMAVEAATALMNVAEQGRDAYGLFAHTRPVLGQGFAHAEAMRHQLRLVADAGTPSPALPAWLANMHQHTQAGDVWVMLSDLFSAQSLTLATKAAQLGLDVRVLQLICSQEANLPDAATFMAKAPDGAAPRQQMVEPKRMKSAYQAAFADHQAQIRQQLQRAGASLASWVLGDAPWSAYQAVLQPDLCQAIVPMPQPTPQPTPEPVRPQ